jgi:serine/threonine protein kinase
LDKASERSVSIEALAHAPDGKGRRAIDVATHSNKRILWRRMFMLGRYEKLKLLHNSGTSKVWQVEDKEAEDEELKVLALKEIHDEVNYLRESAVRAQYGLSEVFVAGIVRQHGPERILLMPLGDCSLEDAMSKELFAGMSADVIRALNRQLVQALMHVHSRGLVHGDLKGKNVCRFGSAWRLIDFDAAAKIGSVVGLKIQPGQSPANVPPEHAAHLLRVKLPANAIRFKLDDAALPPAAHSTLQACLAIVDRLDQEGFDPLTCTLNGVGPDYDIWALGLLLFRTFTAARLFHSDELDELDEKQLCKLAVWSGIRRAELRRHVFSKAEPGTVPNSEKDSAVQLVAACLEPDSASRPQSIEDLLQLSYFRTQGSNARAKILFVSTPGKGLDERTGFYDFDVMGWLQELCRSYPGRLVVAYDWAGSSSADPRDQQWFDRIFVTRDPDGMTLFDRWREAPTASEKDPFVDDVQALLYETRWFSSYKGSIKAQIRETCQSGVKAILVRLEGGPITQVEARAMGELIAEAKSDLAQLGVPEPKIELHAFETVTAFAERGLRGFLSDAYDEDYPPIPTSLLASLPPCDEVRTDSLPAEGGDPQLAVAQEAVPRLAVPFPAARNLLVEDGMLPIVIES